MKRTYLSPPVSEAICEIRIPPETEWDLTIPGLYFARISDELPLKEQRRIRNVEVMIAEEGLREELLIRERMQFFTVDRNVGVQVGPHLLVVNMLRPYSSWSRFRPRIEHAFAVLQDLVKVPELSGLELRYINVIRVPTVDAEPQEYFSIIPAFGAVFPGLPHSFLAGCEIPYADGRDACRVEITDAIPEREDETAFLLDIDYFLSVPNRIPAEIYIDWLNQAHERVIEIFELCITDSARVLFKEVKER